MSGCSQPTPRPPTTPWQEPPAPAPAPTPSTDVNHEELRFDRQTMIPLLYGRKRINGKPIPIGVAGNKIYVAYVFCEGPIGGFDEYFIDDNPTSEYTGLYSFTPYTGELDQPVDPEMAAVNPEWLDNLAGTAWVSAWFLADEKFTGIPDLSAWVRGKLVDDYRGSRAAVYSTNPVLCLVDLLRSRRYGSGIPDSRIDWTSAVAVANTCDELVNGEKRFELNYFIRTPTTVRRAREFVLRHFCGELVFSEGVYKFFIHAPRASQTEYTEADLREVTLQRPKRAEVYNQIRATYYRQDTGQEDELTIETDPTSQGVEPLASKSIDLTGCSLFSQVNRVCVFELNRHLSDLKIVFTTHDTRGLEPFDRFTLSHSLFGLAAVDFYVQEIRGDKITATEYDESIFSDEVKSYDPLPEADLPLPYDLPEPPSNLSLTEYPLQAVDSTYSSYVACVWHASPSSWVDGYEVSYKTPDLSDFVVYVLTNDLECALWTTSRKSNLTIQVRAVNRWGYKSTPISMDVFIEGKTWVPQWPAGAELRAELAGDTVVLLWDEAIDDDVVRYELRRGAPGDSWEVSQRIAVVDSLNYSDPQCPQGTWQYSIRARDRTRWESVSLTVEVDVSLSPDLGFSNVVRLELTGAASENILVYPGNSPNDIAFPVLGIGNDWSARFTGGSHWDDTPGLLWVTVPTDPTAMWLETAPVDFGFLMTADFKMSLRKSQIGSGGTGALTVQYFLSENGTDWTAYGETEEITTSARYVKARFEWSITSPDDFWVVGEPVTIHSSAMPVIDYGTVSIDSSGIVSIIFAVTFNAIDRVKVTPLTGMAKFAVADNMTLAGMDIKTFDTDGSAVECDVNWEVRGI